MPAFVGLDLAWTAHRDDVPEESGLCVLRGEHSHNLTCTRIDATRYHITELAEQLAGVEGSVLAAIDAPLIVTGDRKADTELSKAFSYPYYAGPYTATPDWLDQGDMWAGPRLGVLLDRVGFTLDPVALKRGDRPDRMAIEVYPHPIHVSIFNLPRRILYKKGSVETKRRGLRDYQRYLRQYLARHTPSVLQSLEVQRVLDPATLQGLPGSSKKAVPTLKHYEDTLDGLTCALYAWLVWNDRRSWKVYGDAETGYIVAPRAPA